MPERPPFKDLYFGKTDSRNEYAHDPEDFVRSFVDLKSITGQIVDGERTLILGPKGTGKSALAWYVVATGSGSDHLATVVDATSLPLAEIPQLETGQPAGPDRTVTAWKFILLANYLALLLTDQSAQLSPMNEIKRVVRLLRDHGLVGDAEGKAFLSVSKSTIQVPIPKVGSVYKRESTAKLGVFALVPYLQKWANEARSANRHVLFLDGLDSIFLNDPKYDESLSSLTQAAYSLNQEFRREGSSGSIALLLRNDVFGRVALTVPDSQKMRDDFGAELDWRILSGAAGARAPLVRLANLKAAHASGRESLDVLAYFPKDIELGGSGRAPTWVPVLRYLLNLTRHTPRDFLRLLEEIRRVEEEEIFPPSREELRKDVVREGVLRYANNYFVGAIRNEFAGAEIGAEVTRAALACLQGGGRQQFTAADLRGRFKDHGICDRASQDSLLRMFFFAGAIGNVSAQKNSYLQFYHRRDDADVYLGGKLMLHNALVHAWSIPFDGRA